MSGNQGLLIFGPDGGPTKVRNAYDSRKPRLQADMTRTPKHMAILDDFPGGTGLVSTADGSISREILLPIPHHLPYTPEAIVYFYVKKYNGSITDPKAGLYGGNIILYSGSSGTIADQIVVEVDSQEVRIVHTLQDLGFGGGYVSDAAKYLLRLKYYIFSNNSHVASYSDTAVVV